MTAHATDGPPPGLSRAGRYYWRLVLEPWLYLTPSIALICLVMLVPLAIGITYSFQSIILLKPMEVRLGRP